MILFFLMFLKGKIHLYIELFYIVHAFWFYGIYILATITLMFIIIITNLLGRKHALYGGNKVGTENKVDVINIYNIYI